MPASAQAGTTSSSISRSSRLQGFCAVTKAHRPRASETARARAICPPEKLEQPTKRTLPWRTSASSASSVSSMGVDGSGRWIW